MKNVTIHGAAISNNLQFEVSQLSALKLFNVDVQAANSMIEFVKHLIFLAGNILKNK